jgi:hypothetical protein
MMYIVALGFSSGHTTTEASGLMDSEAAALRNLTRPYVLLMSDMTTVLVPTCLASRQIFSGERMPFKREKEERM